MTATNATTISTGFNTRLVVTPNRRTMRPNPTNKISAVPMFTMRSMSAIAWVRPAIAVYDRAIKSVWQKYATVLTQVIIKMNAA